MKRKSIILTTALLISFNFLFWSCGENTVDSPEEEESNLEQYAGFWNGYEKGVTSIVSTFGNSSEAYNEPVTNVEVKKISETALLIGGDTARVDGLNLSFTTKSVYAPELEMNVNETKSGKLLDNKIEIYRRSSGGYSIMGITVSMTDSATITLTK
ncbi:MAG: hypothetical protein EOM47_07300 [Bacteroidia bacterium]|jgi:hypothetical protein|nr:hypothetical protein [Bacteroidia bacterium]